MATTLNAGTATGGAAISADTTGVLALQSGSTPTTAVTIDASQNVGIGTASPTAKLHVYGGSNNQFKVQSSGAEANFTLAGTSYGQINNDVGDLYLTNGASANIIFRTASTERMRLDTSGNLLFNSGYGSVAIAYGCRAWALFNGGNGNTAGDIAGSGNVSSITVNGTGDYTVNFTTAMPNANYCVQTSGQRETTGGNISHIANISNNSTSSISSGSVRVGFANDGGTSVNAYKYCVAVFR